MSPVGFIRFSLKQMHTTYNEAISDLSPEQMSWPASSTRSPDLGILRH